MQQGKPPFSSRVIAGEITGVTVSHQQATIGAIERTSDDEPARAMEQLLQRPKISECFTLQTCNRVEWYVVTPPSVSGRKQLLDEFSELSTAAARWLSHDESLEHLLRVATGLESMVIGEDQILGQLRQASEDAQRIDGLGYLLEEAVWKAIHCGERARAETGINEGVVSLARAGTQLADEVTTLRGSTVAVVGAGEMGRRASEALADARVASLSVVNRTLPHAEHIANTVGVEAEAYDLDRLPEVVSSAELVITATGSPSPVLTRSHFTGAGPITVVDLGQPRDVHPEVNALSTVELYDLDDIEAITTRTRAEREQESAAVEAIIDRELDRLHAQFKRKQADAVIAAMYEGATAIKRRELQTARNKLAREGELSSNEEEVLDDLADALIGQLLAAPTKSLRDAAEDDDWETLQTALQLFDPELPDGRVSVSEAAASERTEINEDA